MCRGNHSLMRALFRLFGLLISLVGRTFGFATRTAFRGKPSRLRHIAILAFAAILIEEWLNRKPRPASPIIDVTPPKV